MLRLEDDIPPIDFSLIDQYGNDLLPDSVVHIEDKSLNYSLIKTIDEELYLVSHANQLGRGKSSIGVFKGWQLVKDEKQHFLLKPVAVKIQIANAQVRKEQEATQILYPKETKPIVLEERIDRNEEIKKVAIHYAYLITKYLPHKSLADRKNDISELSVSKKLRLITNILKIVEYLHQKKWIHGDLTAENILLDDKFHPYLTDFGNAKKIGGSFVISSPGSAGHLAKESIIGMNLSDNPEEKIIFFSEANDILSISPVLMSILGAEDPLRFKLTARNSAKNLDEKNRAEVYAEFDLKGIENFLKDVPLNENARKIFISTIKEHLERMGNNDYRLRPTIKQSMKFFTQAREVLEKYQLKKSSFSIVGLFSLQDDLTLLQSIAKEQADFKLKL